MSVNPWIVRKPGISGRIPLFCFSYAGGNAASFMDWQDLLDPQFELRAVQLPGRGTRIREQPFNSMSQLIEELGRAIEDQLHGPFVFFGHSLGGLIAFEMARYCRRYNLPQPGHVVVSGCAAPRSRLPARRIHELDDDALIEVLRGYNGTPPALLAQREFMTLMLPAIRADFRIVADYRYMPEQTLDTNLTVFAGMADAHVPLAQNDGWRDETNKAFQMHVFKGDHFFIIPERAAVVERLNQVLTAGLCP